MSSPALVEGGRLLWISRTGTDSVLTGTDYMASTGDRREDASCRLMSLVSAITTGMMHLVLVKFPSLIECSRFIEHVAVTDVPNSADDSSESDR